MTARTRSYDYECVDTACVLCGCGTSGFFAKGGDYEYRTSDRVFTFVQCSACGHVYLNPRPSDRTLHLAYPSDYYTLSGRHTTGRSRLIARFKSLVINRRLRFFRPLLSGRASVLEVGCGDGSLLMDLKRRYPGLEISGLDMALPQGAAARCSAMGIAVRGVSVEQAELGLERFDLIIMNQVIEHVADPVAVMEKLSAALKPGGYVSIETPNPGGYDRRLFRQSFWGGYYFPRHLHLFGRRDLRYLMERAGLDVIVQNDLLAPIIWIFSVHALLFHGFGKDDRKNRLAGWVSDRNPALLAVFTGVDLLARFLGCQTSNQKIIARKIV